MIKRYSLIGTTISLLFHSALFSGIWWVINHHQSKDVNKELTSISMEMITAILDQPEIVAPVSVQDEPEEPEKEPDSIPKPVERTEIKPIEKPKAKPKLKPVEKPKEKPKTQVKKENFEPRPLAKNAETKISTVSKLIPNTALIEKGQKPKNNISPMGQQNNDEFKAYIAKLHRFFYKRINDAYPLRERNKGIHGIVIFEMSVNPSGQITNIILVKPSGNSRLDEIATKVAQQNTKIAPPPNGFPGNFRVPLRFGPR